MTAAEAATLVEGGVGKAFECIAHADRRINVKIIAHICTLIHMPRRNKCLKSHLTILDGTVIDRW